MSLLKLYQQHPSKEPKEIALKIVNSKEQQEVEKILAYKTVQQGGITRYKYLVRQLGFILADNQQVVEEDFKDSNFLKEYYQEHLKESLANYKG